MQPKQKAWPLGHRTCSVLPIYHTTPLLPWHTSWPGALPSDLSGVVAHQHTPRHPEGGGIPSPRAWPPATKWGPISGRNRFKNKGLMNVEQSNTDCTIEKT